MSSVLVILLRSFCVYFFLVILRQRQLPGGKYLLHYPLPEQAKLLNAAIGIRVKVVLRRFHNLRQRRPVPSQKLKIKCNCSAAYKSIVQIGEIHFSTYPPEQLPLFISPCSSFRKLD
jgi:hypothetical protein